MLSRIALPLLAVSSWAQGQSNAGFRLSFVEKIYIDQLGEGEAARIIRDQLTGAFLNRTRGLTIVTEPSQADAILTGNATIKTAYRQWAAGSSQSSADATAAANGKVSAAASAASSSSRVYAGGGTIRITELGLQLVSTDGRVLWAYDGSKCLNKTTLVLVGVPTWSPATVCAVQQLTKAMDRDNKESRSHR
jgi:hypothetical protein